jgi:hypothetical protein
MFPHAYKMGSLQLLLNEMQEDDLNSIGCNLWKEEAECLQLMAGLQDAQLSNLCEFWHLRSEEEVSVEVKNWKSLRRRSAHLLAEQVIVVLTFEGFLKGGNSLVVQTPMPTCLKASIASLFCFV